MGPALNSDEATPTTDMDTSTVPGEDIDPSEVTKERGWMVCYRNRSLKRLQALRAEKPSKATVSPSATKQGIAKHALRLPPLPREHVKVVFRSQGGLDVFKISTATLRSATIVASGLPKLQASENILCPNAAGNVFAMSTPSIERTKTYSMERQLNIANRAYSTLPYVASPLDTYKGVIHGIPPEDTPQDIIDNIVNSANLQAIDARGVGTQTPLSSHLTELKSPSLYTTEERNFAATYTSKNRKHALLAEKWGIGLASARIRQPAASRDVGSISQKTTHIRPRLIALSAKETTLLETKAARGASSHRLFQASHPSSRHQGKTVLSTIRAPWEDNASRLPQAEGRG
ncbi:hypothetical protein HPB48_025997 [Haemaphysalis longicornis]|uniref:Uncharacterized protein n=1 Tax=Haemaphysalis longicornis TaxID=44386 RepID=A0A9J6H8F7_HAELO|nr:hypothetical protein HPB48_025997 [Haemaphysalis longicornis]